MAAAATPADITSDLAVVISKELLEVVAWRNNGGVHPSPRVAVENAAWQGDKLVIKLASGQVFMGVFTELTGMKL